MAEELHQSDESDFMDPRPLGLVVCESICQDLATGNLGLFALFGTMVTPGIPLRRTRAHATITNVREDLDLKFMIVDDEDTVITKSPPGDEWMHLPRPADIMVEAVFIAHFAGVEFPKYGNFFVQVWTRKRSIMERRMLVLEPTPPPEQST